MPLRKQESYDPSLNPFTDDPDDSSAAGAGADTDSRRMPSPSQSKASSRVSDSSQSRASVNSQSSRKSQSSMDWTNPFADDMDDGDDDVMLPPRLAVDSLAVSSDSERYTCPMLSVATEERRTSLTMHAVRAGVPVYHAPPQRAKSNSESDHSESSTQLSSPSFDTAPATPERKRVRHRHRKGQAPCAPGRAGAE